MTDEQSDQTKEDAKNEKASEVTDKTKVTEQAETETTGTTEKDKTTEVTETTENTETTEVTETTENTEATEVTESTEKTEETEKPEGTETTEETETKATDVSKVILITDSEYQVVSIDQSIPLPDYVFYPNSDTDKTAVEWTVDDLNVAEVATTTDANGKVSGTVKAKAAGVAVVKLQVVGKTEVNAAFRLIVRPTNEPKNCKADATYNSVSLSWSPVADANGYTITRKVEGSDTEQTIAHVDGTDTVSYKDTAAQTGISYIYHVYAYTKYTNNGQTDYANTDTYASVKATPQLGKAAMTSVTAEGYSSLTLKWEKVDGATGYIVYRSTDKSKVDTQLTDITNGAVSYVDAALTAGTTYYYKVQPYRVVNGKKVCGILTEMNAQFDYINHIVVGIGINVHNESFPEEIRQMASSLMIEAGGKRFHRAQIIAETMSYFEQYYDTFLKTQDLSALVREYDELLVNRNKSVRVLDPKEPFDGKAMGITPKGELIVDTWESRKLVSSGEVSVRGIYGYV